MQLKAFQQLNAQVVAVSFTPPGRVAAFLTAHPLPFPALSDPERKAYRAFSLGKTSWRAMLHPRVLWGYLKLIWRGTRPEKP
jgi:peroxiredoxin